MIYRISKTGLLPGIVATVFWATVITLGVAADSGRNPNIVLILADDLGYGDLGCYGQRKIKTPNLDRMAAEGMRFTDFYCGCSVCAPSRCTLLTGKHLGHATVRDNMQRGPGLEGQHPMQPGTVTVAQLLKTAGYATAIVGKWGLGMPEDHSSPLDFGFDHHYGYLCQGMAHTYYPPYLWRDNHKEMLDGNPPYTYGQPGVIPLWGKVYSHDLLVEDALRWVRAHKDGPFFLELAFTIPHLSLQVPEDSLAQYRGKWPETPVTTSKHYANQPTPRAAYAAMITRMDRDVGRLMALLEQLGLGERTVVLFASDNGAVFALNGTDPDFFQSNGNLRGYKQDLYEGGIRTPLIARWPGRIAAGATSRLIGAFLGRHADPLRTRRRRDARKHRWLEHRANAPRPGRTEDPRILVLGIPQRGGGPSGAIRRLESGPQPREPSTGCHARALQSGRRSQREDEPGLRAPRGGCSSRRVHEGGTRPELGTQVDLWSFPSGGQSPGPAERIVVLVPPLLA